ncbi:mitochondrial presequence translocase-assisted motor (PAM complex) Tim14 subunit (Pam18) [Andalucia godoyi]|uniref:Mitochondrial presequence translocase-assisted motor (PAM complex) Tim14 subunit (Pam18) n=1 Tax=Andalucia godoyi TaxID=505711 RepID=A0A8K0AIP7_ANDGO|nr:mitochondrial presequence translocase-assisted motor (PAM complex) Tim14 subunit (Pam18) [Andalucia godoyi]|eukprot:ANDGO_04174.mRNA.1 mitochondrial presequence translocase-assisted motor (PAM complex) Tim14 subunit (Pam18)
MATIFLAGLGVAGAALVGRAVFRAARSSGSALKSVPKTFYMGSFEDVMSRREASLILGVNEKTTTEEIKEAHRRLMRINHPDVGGSTYIGTKINLAKQVLETENASANTTRKPRGPSSNF